MLTSFSRSTRLNAQSKNLERFLLRTTEGHESIIFGPNNRQNFFEHTSSNKATQKPFFATRPGIGAGVKIRISRFPLPGRLTPER